jgi:hypothetical protein
MRLLHLNIGTPNVGSKGRIKIKISQGYSSDLLLFLGICTPLLAEFID